MSVISPGRAAPADPKLQDLQRGDYIQFEGEKSARLVLANYDGVLFVNGDPPMLIDYRDCMKDGQLAFEIVGHDMLPKLRTEVLIDWMKR